MGTIDRALGMGQAGSVGGVGGVGGVGRNLSPSLPTLPTLPHLPISLVPIPHSPFPTLHERKN
ncbi:MAG: hypothetical protein RMY28_023145 [Nostoc sp. ChiSLP01]